MTDKQKLELALNALRAVRTGVTREKGADSTGHGYAHIRMASVVNAIAALTLIEAE